MRSIGSNGDRRPLPRPVIRTHHAGIINVRSQVVPPWLLNEDVDTEHYLNVPGIGSERLEIAFIEAVTAECGRGIDTQAVPVLDQRS